MNTSPRSFPTGRDTLGWRKVFGVFGPSTNTVVEPEFAAMRPAGASRHRGQAGGELLGGTVLSVRRRRQRPDAADAGHRQGNR